MEEIKKDTYFLVVDDNDTMAHINKKMLQAVGYTNIDLALSGEQAIVKVKEQAANGTPYEVVFLDWNMPEVSGIDVLRAVREDPATQKTYIIMVTAESNRENIILAIQEGVDDYVTKPYTPEVVSRKLEKIAKIGFREIVQYENEYIEKYFVTHQTDSPESKELIHLIEEKYYKAVKLAPNDEKDILSLARFLIKIHSYNFALKLINYVLSFSRMNAEAHYLSSRIYFVTKHFDEARKRLQRTLEIKPGYADAQVLMGEIDFYQKHYDNAAKLFTQALKTDPENPRIFYKLAVTLCLNGNREKGKVLLEKAMELNPSYSEAKTLYEKLFQK